MDLYVEKIALEICSVYLLYFQPCQIFEVEKNLWQARLSLVFFKDHSL